MEKIMTVSEIELNNGWAASSRTVASVTGLAPETKVEFIRRQSRWTGTGYRDDIYRICGTDDALIIHHCSGSVDNIYWDRVEVKKGLFAQQRAYGAACHEASRRFGLPMEVCLAVGPKLCEEFKAEADKVVYPAEWDVCASYVEPYQLNTWARRELSCGINRRKKAILDLLAGCSEELKAKISQMGQLNSGRIARFLTITLTEKRDGSNDD